MNQMKPDEQGWIGVKTTPVFIQQYLSSRQLEGIYDKEIEYEPSAIVSETNPHFTVIYGLKPDKISEAALITMSYKPDFVTIENIEIFEQEEYNICVALLKKTNRILELREEVLKYPHFEQEFPDYKPHITLCYLKKDFDYSEMKEIFQKNFINKSLQVTGVEVDNPWAELRKVEDGNCTGNV